MRIITNHYFRYREMAGRYYLIPVAEEAEKAKIPMELTETAAWIWLKLDAGIDTEAIAAEMTEEFEVELEDAIVAIEQFSAFLMRKGMAKKNAEVQ